MIEWEGGDNKTVEVKGAKTLQCSWGSSELEMTEKKAPRKRSSSPKKKKTVANEVAVADEVAAPVVAEATPEPTPEQVVLSVPAVVGDEIMYTFDEGDHGESAADIAKRMYGQ